MRIILVNGPPRSGKDTIAEHFARKGNLDPAYTGAVTLKFAGILKERTHALYGNADKPADYYEQVKDLPHDDFYGLTPRKAYIALSETYFKKQHGQDIFGRLLADEIDKYLGDGANPVFLISDSGFVLEAEVLLKKYGPTALFIARLHRPGTTFVGDSRGYITLPGVKAVDFHNEVFADLDRIADAITGELK